jgi:hypothetical protein
LLVIAQSAGTLAIATQTSDRASMTESEVKNNLPIEASPEEGEPIGQLLQRERVKAGRSQGDQAFLLSDISGRPVTRNDVSRWENEGRLIGESWQHAYAKSFGIPEARLRRAVIFSRSVRRQQDGSSRSSQAHRGRSAIGDAPAQVRQFIPALRSVLDLYDMPEDGPVMSVDDLRSRTARLVGWRLNSEYSKLASELQVMLPELTRALHTYRAGARADVASLLVQAYRAADAVVNKFGLYDLSARTINILQWAAEQAQSPTTVAISAYVRGENFFASGEFASGRRVLERAAEQVRVGTTVGESAAFGALHMRAAVLAARAGQSDYARAHLREAHDAARQVDEGVYGGTAFGPGSVRIHEVSLALNLDDPTGALAAAAGWEPGTSLPAERRSHFYVDLARAQLLTRRYDHVGRSLHKAWTIAPQHIRAHPQVRAILTDATISGEAGLRDMRRQIGVSPG